MEYAIVTLDLELDKLKTRLSKIETRYGTQSSEYRNSELQHLIQGCQEAIEYLENC